MAPRSAQQDQPHQATEVRPHLVVDGSNIATEGRESPSLTQLDEAVQAYMREYDPQIVTVVVDATFPNRIARSERATYEAAVNAGEIITPPAGAIGRGDAFILQIADRADATILSNDSFQEFHGLYLWLFEPGRLVGGKPVPHVGWVFVDRSPVRGPLSRRAVSAAKKAAVASVAAVPTKSAAAKKQAAKKQAAKADKPTKKEPAQKQAGKKQAAAKQAAPKQAAPKQAAAKKVAPAKAAAAPKPAAVEARTSPGVSNEALPFIEFVGAHPVGSALDAVVEQFSSHGAYVRIGDVQGYVPLKYLGEPAPRSAKQALRLGESRSFVVVAVDPGRRGVDLALPAFVPPGIVPPEPAKKAPAKKRAAKKSGAARKRTPNK